MPAPIENSTALELSFNDNLRGASALSGYRTLYAHFLHRLTLWMAGLLVLEPLQNPPGPTAGKPQFPNRFASEAAARGFRPLRRPP